MKPVSIGELGRLFNPAPGRKVLALLCTYLDASLNGKPPGIASVAGYVAPLAEWERIEAEWQDGLKLWSINPFRLSGLHRKIGLENAKDCTRFFTRIIEDSQLNAVGAAILDVDWHRPDWG